MNSSPALHFAQGAIANSNSPRLIRMPEVKSRTGIGRSAIYAKVANKDFPAPIKIGARAVAWLSTDIDAWIEQQIAASKAAA